MAQDHTRRTVLQILLSTGLVGSGFGIEIALASNGTKTDEVVMDELTYHLNHSSDKFDGTKTITNGGAIRYEKEKHTPSDSPYTWQSGSWVNAFDDSSGSNSLTGLVWWSGSKNSEVTITETSDSPSNLVLDTVKVYWPDDNTDQSSEIAAYALGEVWNVITSSAPFSVPTPPFGLLLDNSNNSGKTIVDQQTTKVTFNDPSPAIGSNDSITHSVDWKWEVMGGVEPGWHYVGGNREVDNGYYQMYNGQTSFGDEEHHQLTLVSAFCFYESDASVCDVDTPPGVRPQDESCCQPVALDKHVSIDNDLLASARSRAEEVYEESSFSESTRFGQQAQDSYEAAAKFNDPFLRLVANRSAAAHARGAAAYEHAQDEPVDADSLRDTANQLQQEIDNTHARLSYNGNNLPEAVATAAQVEKSLASAESWVGQVASTLNDDQLSTAQRAMYATSAVEFGRGTLADGQYYHEVATVTEPNTDWDNEIATAYQERLDRIESMLHKSAYSDESHPAHVVRNAQGYVDRARERFNGRYKALALVDLVVAQAHADSAAVLAETDMSSLDDAAVEVDQELSTDRFNQAAGRHESGPALPVLNVARLELQAGNDSFAEYETYRDVEAREKAYVHFHTARTLVDAANDLGPELTQ